MFEITDAKIAILCLTAIALGSLYTHTDGNVLTFVIIGIAGIAGYDLGKRS